MASASGFSTTAAFCFDSREQLLKLQQQSWHKKYSKEEIDEVRVEWVNCVNDDI